jgi:hypothetical protein
MDSTCIVFVTNIHYFNKFIETCTQLLTNGNYKGDICLVIGDDLKDIAVDQVPFIYTNNIIIKYFPDIKFDDNFTRINTVIDSDGRNIHKKFQWHKLHLFNTFFKKWNYIFYIDCGMTIFSDVQPIIDEKTKNTLLAHSDAYPTYEWKLSIQFCKRNVEYYTKLNSTYKLEIDYFQTGIMLYDTSIIEDTTFQDLYNLSLEYPISRTNEQGITALYFTNIKPLWKQLKIKNNETYLYDARKRDESYKYIINKCI